MGDKKLLVDRDLSNRLLSTKESIVKRLKACLEKGELEGQPLGEEEEDVIGSMLEDIEPQSIELICADLEQKNRIVRERRRHPDALVLVETSAGSEEGKVVFKSTSFDEFVEPKSGRVKRKYRDVFPPPGVTVIEEGRTREGNPCFLLRMVPSASLRIERTGLLEGEPSVLTIVWKGRKGSHGASPMLMFSPERRQDQ